MLSKVRCASYFCTSTVSASRNVCVSNMTNRDIDQNAGSESTRVGWIIWEDSSVKEKKSRNNCVCVVYADERLFARVNP